MPTLTRPSGIPLGQIGQIRSDAPREQDSGIGGILTKAAQLEFSAAREALVAWVSQHERRKGE
jgi:hypothetical protein